MRTHFSLIALAGLLATTAAVAQETRLPMTGVDYDSQLGGPYNPALSVGIVSRDRTAPPVRGLYSICYVNAFQTQPDEGDWWRTEHPDLLLEVDGAPLEDSNWPGEYILDISTDEKREALAGIVGEWIDQCASDGFNAIEADNLDTWTRSHHMIGMENAIDYARRLARRAHASGLAIAQKNAVELGTQGPDIGFDFAIVENCAVYDECGEYRAVYGDYVFQIEYDHAVFEAACTERGRTDVIVLRDRMLAPKGEPGHVFGAC